MKSKDADSLQIVANILGNISAIAAGIAIFERVHSASAITVAIAFAAMAVFTV